MRPTFLTRPLVLLQLLLVAGSLPAAQVVTPGSTWRFLRGTAEASVPPSAWRGPAFNDAGFANAPAPFWYGDARTGGTQLVDMRNTYTCFFLRQSFMINNIGEIGGLKLDYFVDDGFVMWINGIEVFRYGVTAPDPTIATLAVNQPVDPAPLVSTTLSPAAGALQEGVNWVAVQVFNTTAGSSDTGFDLGLETIVTETVPPTVASASPAPGQVTHLAEITVTFSEPVQGVTAAHLLVNGIGAADVTAIDSATYRFSFVQPAYGPVSIGWNPGHTVFDQALPPNRFDATGPGATWTYSLVDQTTPTVAALSPAAGATVRSLSSITVLFSEPVSGVDAADLLINNIPASSVATIAASQYIFTFPEPAIGPVDVAWVGAHAIIDQATPPNPFAGGGWSCLLDPDAADAPPYISEFMASNTRTLADEDGFQEDWIEIYNPGDVAVDLDGWYLTDNAGDLTRWRFPSTNLAGGGFLVVFASGNDRRVPGARLHTGFRLTAGGEYLALVRPDGVSVTSEFSPAFPQQVLDVSYGFTQSGPPPTYTTSSEGVYFTTPTPGAVNLGGSAVPGPVIEEVQHAPNVPLDHEDLLVTARVRPSFLPIAAVTLRYRIMFGSEVSTPMFDDGAHGDGAAGDGLYAATIPANLSTNGQMIRYLVAATDVNAGPSRWPLFTSPTATEEYLGTIVDPASVTSQLPIFHLFVSPGETPRIDTEGGGRIAFFYDGEFYDNVYMELRGNTSAGLAKKAHRLEFNRGHELRHAGPGGRTRKSSLLGEYLDPAYLRQHLCFWFLNQIGVPAPYDYPVRVQLNGQFYQLAFHNDVIGQEQVERMGYDPRGALYKAVGNLVPSFASTGVFQKLEPDNDASRTDYLQLANGINETSPIATRRNTVFDLLDLPQVINHLAGTRWCSENDDVWANMSLYRDTFGDGLWRNIPFDMNASWGQLYGGSNPLEATVDNSKSHPLYGGSSTGGNYNRLYDVIVALPETREMLLRRQRSIMDQWIQPPGTPAASLIIENYIMQMTNLISVEANLDRAKWGFSPWAGGKTFANGVGDLLNQFVGPRRQHWFVTHSITNTSKAIGIGNASNAGIPLTQPADAILAILDVEFNPAGGNQEQEFISINNPAPFAIDITGWRIEGGAEFTFAPGTVIPSNGVAYVSPNTPAFRARTSGPRGGQGLFVLGPYQGQLSARGETLRVLNPLGHAVYTHAYPGNPSPAQQFLRITEILFHPAPLDGNPTPSEEFEYIELRNISTTATLNLAGVRLINGVEFDFSGGAITTLLPGARLLVVKNSIAFNTRYGPGLPVTGQFTGNLDNNGERIQLLDASNEEILDFSFDDDWHPLADGFGFSLVVVDENAEPGRWGSASNWRASGLIHGSPGAQDPGPPAITPVLVNEVLSRTETPPPTDTIELHNPTAEPADLGGWYLTDDFAEPTKFRIPPDTTIAANGYLLFDESQFNTGPNAFALGSDGDEAYLFSANSSGELTGYYHGFKFGPAASGVPFGLHVISTGKEQFVAQSAPTLGGANAGPKVGPIAISEVMYHPAAGLDESLYEFIELVNITDQPVALSEPPLPAGRWRLADAVDFVFPEGFAMDPLERVLIVGFDPAADPAALTVFRSHYGVDNGLRVLGPFDGRLDNDSDSVELKKPAGLPLSPAALVLLDKVEYLDHSPWPAAADGFGLSLQRFNESAYGNDPANWRGAPPTPGLPRASGGNPPAITAEPANQDVLAGADVQLAVSVTGTGPLQYQWRFEGNPIAGASGPTLNLPGIGLIDRGSYDVVVYNNYGSAISREALINVLVPASITAQPQSVSVLPGASATLSIQAFSPSPLSYQWRRNGIPIPGATGPTLTFAAVDVSDVGAYDVALTDSIGTVVSDTALLRVLIPPVIMVHPFGQTNASGSTITLSVQVTNTATLPVSYRWRKGGGNVAIHTLNSTIDFLTLSNIQLSDVANYTVVVTNDAFFIPGYITSIARIGIAAPMDADGDGMPDDYELANGLDEASPADAALDADGDGISNKDEFLSGTDPQDENSFLRITSVTSSGGTRIQFPAVESRTYSVQYRSEAAAGPWGILTGIPAISASGLNTRLVEVIDPSPVTEDRYYRLMTPAVSP